MTNIIGPHYFADIMCRLFAQIASEPQGIGGWMQGGPRPFVDWSTEHKHGWGIGWYQSSSPILVKEPKPARESNLFARTAESAKSQIVICHLRKATCGEYTVANSQPFMRGNWLFAHNGTVDREHLFGRLDRVQFRAEGETDSELYFLWLLQNLEDQGVLGLQSALDAVRQEPFTALNFVASDGQSAFAYWEQSPTAKPSHPDYYQLYYRESPGSVVICSERLDDGEWVRLPQRTVMAVSAALRIQSFVID